MSAILNFQDFDYSNTLSSLSFPKMQDFDYSSTLGSINLPSMEGFDYTSAITRPQLELAWNIAAYSAIMWHHTRRSAPAYKKTFGKQNNWALAAHIFAGLFEVFRLHIRALYGPAYPDFLDLIACFVQSGTNLILVKPLRRGHPSITRTSYQAGGLLRPIVSSIAYLTNDPALHRGSVKMVNAFVYTRMDIWILVNLNIVKSYATIYAFAVTHGAMQAIYEGTGLTGLSIYTALIGVLMVFERAVSNYMGSDNAPETEAEKEETHSEPTAMMATAQKLVHMGFAELHTIQQHNRKHHGVQTQIDEYIAPKYELM